MARSRHELARLLDRALAEPEVTERMHTAMQSLGRPDASHRVADAVLEQVAARQRS